MLSDRTIRALTGISKATLQPEVRIKHLFRIMTHYPDLWMRAYANIYSNKGALTKGVNNSTLDGMGQERIQALIDLLTSGKYKPQPAKRVLIPKQNGKLRPLGIPTGDDKLVQEVIRILLEVIFEPTFSDSSHGFRPKRSCHSALAEMKQKWKGVKWIIDMDISGFYDNINHDLLIDILEKKIDDERFIKIIKMLLKSGYLENWKYHGTYSGTPQGGVCSPILANIVLNELDKFVESKVSEFNKGERRKQNRVHERLCKHSRNRRKQVAELTKSGGCFPWVIGEIKTEIANITTDLRKTPSQDQYDENFKRLNYVRYADDFAMGVVGSKNEAKALAEEISGFLSTALKLEVSKEKSGIYHAKKGFNYLGYHVFWKIENNHIFSGPCGKARDGRIVYMTRRVGNANLSFRAPKERVWDFAKKNEYIQGNKPVHRPKLLNLSDYEIVATYNAELRGLANYYAFAPKCCLRVLESIALRSLFKTLARKHQTKSKMVRGQMKAGDEHILRYQVDEVTIRTLTVFKLKHRKEPDLLSLKVDNLPVTETFWGNNEILRRVHAGKCEYCATTSGKFEVHHVHKLKDIRAKPLKTPWEVVMCSRNRKTLVLCTECHKLLHAGTLQGWKRDLHTEMESRVQ